MRSNDQSNISYSDNSMLFQQQLYHVPAYSNYIAWEGSRRLFA